DRIVLDGAVDPAAAGPGLFVPQAPALSAAFAHWAAWTAARDSTYGLGATAEQIRATVGRIIRVTNRRSLVLGPFRVDAHVLPLLLARQLGDDSDSSYATLATDVRTLSAAAQGTPAEPSDALHEFLTDLFTGSGPATDRAGTPILCADRAVSRDPETYYRDIQAHRGTEPLFGPLTRNITPCAYWAVTPAEPPVTVRNKVPVLIVGAGGDPLTPYPGQQAMHRALTRSRLVTLQGAYRHGVYLAAASPCIDQAVTRYLTSGALPPGDAACIPQPGTAAR
ncbi:MAG: hypothetical protein QOJ50_3991, partial [Cryptosporangiaceae bacterium]|nr:hypothetical protein [Cryptosporangiaceae bacterium]